MAARVTHDKVEVLEGNGTPLGRVTQEKVEVLLANGTASARITTLAFEVLSQVVLKDGIANNVLSLSQSVSYTADLARSANNTLTISQLAAKSLGYGTESTLNLDFSVAFEHKRNTDTFGNIALTHDVVVVKDSDREAFQGLALVHSASVTANRTLSGNNTLTLSQAAVGQATKHTHNELSLTDEALFEYVYGTRNSLEMTQTCERLLTANRNAASNFIPFHSISVNGTYRRSLLSNLTLSQIAVGYSVKAVSSQLTLTQLAEGINSKGTYSQLALVQLVQLNRTTNLHPSNTLSNLHHTVALTKLRSLSASSVVAFSQFARGTRVLSQSVETELTLTQALVADYFDESISDTLVLDQEAIGVKRAPRTGTSLLHLSQSVQVSTTIKRTVAQTLIFNNTFEKYTGITDMPIITIPTVQAVKVKNVVVLQRGTSVIVLNAPEFGDSEGNPSKINVKRAMDATRRIYKRVTPSNKLSYTFVLDRKKAIELRTFILTNNSNSIIMTNWKGEIWTVLMTNNPFSFTEQAFWNSPWGNKCSITLEFEGVRHN